MRYHEKVAITSLLTNFTYVTTMLFSQNIFGWDRETAQKNVKYATKNLRIATSGMLVERLADHFLLVTGDRETLVTDEFLSSCDKDHADAVRRAIKLMAPNETKECDSCQWHAPEWREDGKEVEDSWCYMFKKMFPPPCGQYKRK